MNFLINSIKNYDFYGHLYSSIRKPCETVETEMGVVIEKSTHSFLEWADKQCEDGVVEFSIEDLEFEYNRFITTQLSEKIKATYNTHKLVIYVSKDYDGFWCIIVQPENYPATAEEIEYATLVKTIFNIH